MTEQERAHEIIEEGRIAYSDGLSISESPYLDPSEEHDWWLKGYYRESERKKLDARLSGRKPTHRDEWDVFAPYWPEE